MEKEKKLEEEEKLKPKKKKKRFLTMMGIFFCFLPKLGPFKKKLQI